MPVPRRGAAARTDGLRAPWAQDCGIDVIRQARADAHGEAILHFRWPAFYRNGSARVAWTPGARVDVIVLADSGRGRRVVRFRTD